MFTATDLRNEVCTHHQFYSQFVTDSIKRMVIDRIGLARLIASTDEHLNDIPLMNWDRMNDSVKNMIDREKFKNLYNTTYGPKDRDSFVWSLSCGVCIAKTAARLIIAESIAKYPPLMIRMICANLKLSIGDFGFHASDLYVIGKPGVKKWLDENLEYPQNVTSFLSPADSEWAGAGRLCWDIPFMGNWPGKE